MSAILVNYDAQLENTSSMSEMSIAFCKHWLYLISNTVYFIANSILTVCRMQ